MSSKAPAEPAAPSKKGSLQAHLQRCAVPIQQASLMIRIQGESYPLADVDTLQGLLLDGWVPPHTPTYDRKREQWTEAQYFPGLSDSFQQSWSESRKAQIEQAGSTGPGKHTGWVSGEIKLGAAGASNVDPQQATLGMARFDPKMLEFPDEQTRAEQGMVLAARLGREAEAAA